MDGRLKNGRVPAKSWTIEERRKLKEWVVDKGFTTKQAAEVLGRFYKVVESELIRGGGRKDYDPEKAQAFADTVHERRSEAARKSGARERLVPFTKHLTDKVEALSMQLDILIDIVRKKKGNSG